MRLTQLYLYTSKRQLFIKNKSLKICINCVNFIEHKTNYPYDSLPNDNLYSKCKMFGEQNLITGEIENKFASTCRVDNTKCGIDGKYFTEKEKE